MTPRSDRRWRPLTASFGRGDIIIVNRARIGFREDASLNRHRPKTPADFRLMISLNMDSRYGLQAQD